MSCFRSLSAPLAVALLLFASLGAEAQDKQQELRRVPYTEWWCKVYCVCVCYDADLMEYYECGIDEFEGTGGSENQACMNAVAACENGGSCSEGEPLCCYNETSEFCDGYPPETMSTYDELRKIQGEKVWKTYRDVKFWVISPKQELTRYEFSGVGERDGRRVSLGALDQESAWQVFKRAIDARNGLRPGTLKLRTVPNWFYRSYARVQSRKGSTIYSQEVECTSLSEESAKVGAIDLAHFLKADLRSDGHQDVRVLPSLRSVRILNTLGNASRDSVACRIRCTTFEEGVEIQISRYGNDRDRAFASAREAATSLADDHGGISECTELPSEPLESGKACIGCDSSAAEAAPSEDSETN